MRQLLVLACVAALAACSTPGGQTASGQIQWRCDGGAAFSMHLANDGKADIFAGGHTYSLPGVPAGSGTRYTDGTVEYWEHGSEAMLNGAAGGPYANCHR